jgi:ABC-type transport system involved in multi-copper enzyme maturation permease subunit
MGRGRAVAAIARGVLLEAVRRKDVYVVVVLCCVLIGGAMRMDFFEVEGLVKFYREVALKLMGMATAVATVLLATRQLPREFEQRTIYPLLARPVGRLAFLLGKAAGVWAASVFCLGLFMAVYAAGLAALGGEWGGALFAQHAYLQALQMGVLASACFALSLACSPGAALSLGLLFYFTAEALGDAAVATYAYAGPAGRAALHALNYAMPHLALFDLSGKVVHAELWPPLGWGTLAALTAYAWAYSAVFLGVAYALFRRRAL